MRKKALSPAHRRVVAVQVVSDDQAAAFAALSGYYAALFGNAESFPPDIAGYADAGMSPPKLRNAYAIATNTIRDPERQKKMNAFFWWASWACSTQRPGAVAPTPRGSQLVCAKGFLRKDVRRTPSCLPPSGRVHSFQARTPSLMQIRYAVSKNEYQRMTTRELREAFLVGNFFSQEAIELIYWETDRTVTGSAVPGRSALKLESEKELASEYFCERRELGILNIGAGGKVTVDGTVYELGNKDCLYVGRGSRDISFTSNDATAPAKFYLMSYPAHAVHPTTLATLADANQIRLGSQETANHRTIYQYIHENGIKSCQLVMGFTQLEPGSVWNTMPAHTHSRRSEVYLYFDMPEDGTVFHYMGPGDETRHLLVHPGQAVLSPIWSIHSGCGTRAYTFIWAMGGENQRFADMDGIATRDLR